MSNFDNLHGLEDGLSSSPREIRSEDVDGDIKRLDDALKSDFLDALSLFGDLGSKFNS